eukprot:gene8821-biopygen18159
MRALTTGAHAGVALCALRPPAQLWYAPRATPHTHTTNGGTLLRSSQYAPNYIGRPGLGHDQQGGNWENAALPSARTFQRPPRRRKTGRKHHQTGSREPGPGPHAGQAHPQAHPQARQPGRRRADAGWRSGWGRAGVG